MILITFFIILVLFIHFVSKKEKFIEQHIESPEITLIQKKKTEVEYYETVVDYLQEIVKQIGQRNFQIKNAIEWRKFEAGM